MKQYIVDRHTDPSNPTLVPVPSERIPVYDTKADLESDLANIGENEFVFTKDTGEELSDPVNVVESGNLNAVTSNAVSNSLSYSETEQLTGGKWIDGKPIYRKVIDCGALPNNTTKTVAHNISNLAYVVKAECIAYRASANRWQPLNYTTSAGGTVYPLLFWITNTDVSISTVGDQSPFAQTYTIIEYTKS